MEYNHVMPLDRECFCSLGIHRANFPAVQTNGHMQTMLCQKCKAYVCLDDFENAFFHKTSDCL